MAVEKKAGRPSDFTQELADLICERIADGESLRSICSEPDMPNKSTVFRWLAVIPIFCDQYAHAREAQADSIFDEVLDIADDSRNDWVERAGDDGKPAGWRENPEAINRSRLRIDARKWMAGKLRPRKYGEKLDLSVSGSLQSIPEEQLDARITELLGKAGVGASSSGESPPEGEE